MFNGLGFTLLEGGVIVLAGHNGSGKTTLLKAIAGLIPPQKGEVTFQATQKITHPQDYEQKALYIGHNNAIKLDATVLENLNFWAVANGEPILLQAAVEYMGLLPYINTPCGKLSAGWKRRVALSRLMICPAKLWLLDEPMSNLDDAGVALLGGLIQTRTASHGGVIMAAHGIHQLPFKQKDNQAMPFQVLEISDFMEEICH